jgi:hypothetical protein
VAHFVTRSPPFIPVPVPVPDRLNLYLNYSKVIYM